MSFLGENDNISVDLLIGADCVETLQPLEVIPSQQDEPYACTTILGWCVVGPIVDEKPDAVSCSRIAVLQAENASIAKHHFQVQNKCEVGNHCQEPLPLKNPDVKLPNNRKVAERRLIYLKKRLMKDYRFHQQYTEFMQEILDIGYAKESKSTPPDGRVWYLTPSWCLSTTEA